MFTKLGPQCQLNKKCYEYFKETIKGLIKVFILCNSIVKEKLSDTAENFRDICFPETTIKLKLQNTGL